MVTFHADSMGSMNKDVERITVVYSILPQLRLGDYHEAVEQRLRKMEKSYFSQRFWLKDGSLWSDNRSVQNHIKSYMGWIDAIDKIKPSIPGILSFAKKIKEEGFTHIVLLGMGGSSLAPLVMQKAFQHTQQSLPFYVLDTTDPASVVNIENNLNISTTLFIVASKSGTTTEPNAFMDYFFEKVKLKKGNKAGENFIAITDPDTHMQKVAHERKFKKVFLNYADVGGRYSALTFFGLVPFALCGVDVTEIMERAYNMEQMCSDNVSVYNNPGFVLGAAIGELAMAGRDKLSFVIPDELKDFGLWLEQLIAESTGKHGKGILPVVENLHDDITHYGTDRAFVHITFAGLKFPEIEDKLKALTNAGHPVITIRLENALDIAREFYRWEIATAVAGTILEINPFDQPNVQETKTNTEKLLKRLDEGNVFPDPTIDEGYLKYYTSVPSTATNGKVLLNDFFSQLRPKGYISIMAYLTETSETSQQIQQLQQCLTDEFNIAVTTGFGPRFLHSTGQYHKGGPSNGLFIQLIGSGSEEIVIPGRNYSFNKLIKAQAVGDFEALKEHGLPVLQIELSGDAAKAIEQLRNTINTHNRRLLF